MKRTLVFLALLLALPLAAQEAALTAPETISATKIVIKEFRVQRDCSCADIFVEYRTATESVTREGVIRVGGESAGAELVALLAAMGSPRAGETGNASRRMNFRILGHLADAGKLPGATLVP